MTRKFVVTIKEIENDVKLNRQHRSNRIETEENKLTLSSIDKSFCNKVIIRVFLSLNSVSFSDFCK